jgi:hypothetical protein
VAYLKRYGDANAIRTGELAYRDAKAESDGVIAGLLTSLSERQAAPNLDSLQQRLERSAALRVSFCKQALTYVPDTAGQKGVVADIY